ncbi:MAG: hypothetical protein IPO92_04560 [Saprospiraceae bacterium]|nr:hypothetical protein [Saprospiraceae bacterium]
MNGAHWHLALNHLPIIIPMVGVLILSAGFLLKSEIIKQTALGVFVLGAVATFPAFFTGEGAEEIAEKLPEVTKQLIHNHEEMAETFAIISYLVGVLSLFGLWAAWKQKSYVNIVTILVFVGAMAILYLGKQTGTTGGEINLKIMADYIEGTSNLILRSDKN